MNLDDRLKREAGMEFDGENLQACPEVLSRDAQVPMTMLAFKVLENDRKRHLEIIERNVERLKILRGATKCQRSKNRQ